LLIKTILFQVNFIQFENEYKAKNITSTQIIFLNIQNLFHIAKFDHNQIPNNTGAVQIAKAHIIKAQVIKLQDAILAICIL
jgi:hypothetical protein